VSLKIDFDTAYALSRQETADWPFKRQETVQLPKEQLKHYRQFWEQSEWSRGATDKHGQAELEVESTEIDRSLGSEPPAERDEVTGQPYLVRVKKDQGPEDESRILMKPGESVKGKSSTVSVIEVQAPRYVETKF